MIVEDDEAVGEMIRAVLERSGYAAAVADGPENGLSEALAQPPDLILMDIMMSGMDGYNLAQRLQREERTRYTPVIFVTALAKTSDVVHGLDLGAVDYVVKPFIVPELVSRVKAALRLKASQDELRRANSELAALALADSLTGLHNRRSFMERLEQSIAYSIRRRDPLSCLMLDLDHFKEINDFYGHQKGDIALQQMAGVLRHTVRIADTVGRYGGEEFAVICPSTDIHAAVHLAERVRAAVEAHRFDGPEGRLSITVSVGCAVYDPVLNTGAEALLARADAALYRAKRDGRNCVRSA
ncbi:MAG: diguanylate cyclase [Chloroflexi bacterium]|nr:diguanylate cyclase [Chloroflexota bacterium]